MGLRNYFFLIYRHYGHVTSELFTSPDVADICTAHINTLCEQDVDFLVIKPDGT